jgi:hypothetical protein
LDCNVAKLCSPILPSGTNITNFGVTPMVTSGKLYARIAKVT